MSEMGPSNPQSPPAEGSWQAVLDGVVPAVVALQVTAVRSFQDDVAGAYGGTGFVVDMEQGLLLTNRHVCTCGPARINATFVGCPAMEEVAVQVAYLDPVHDFAFLRFDPKQLQQTPRVQIALDPEGLRVGEEIRVVGNDALEKLQILSGTVARVDRNPPGIAGDYQDENTFYALASSGTRGGSSGSPVLNKQGYAVALNAAAKESTMHAFYLPLHRVARAFRAVRTGDFVPRGTLCTSFAYASFPEVVRLGVDRSFVQNAVLGREPQKGGTFSKATPPGGMLQVQRCVPGTLAAERLQAGDVLLELNGSPCADFVFWDSVLDDSVGESICIKVCRQGRVLDVELTVQDHHALIPHSFLELGLGIFHEVPYQTAMKHHIPLKGVYVAQAGFVFGESVKTDAVILDVNGAPCDDLQSFERALQQIPNKEYFAVGWTVPKCAKERRRMESSVKMQRHWCAFRSWSLDIPTRAWTPRDLSTSAASSPATDVAAPETPPMRRDGTVEAGAEAGLASPKKRARKGKANGARSVLARSLCAVVFRTAQIFDMDLVMTADNVEKDIYCFRGAGIILDPVKGLVLTDRATVPQPLGDIEVTLGEEVRSASVLFVHPLHSLVVLRVDPPAEAQADGGMCFGQAALFQEDVALEPGDDCEFVGMDIEGRVVASSVQVEAVRAGNFPSHFPPRWHEKNLEAVILAENPMSVHTGVLCDPKGNIQALHAVCTMIQEQESTRLGYGIPLKTMQPLLTHFRSAKALTAPFVVPSLEVSFTAADLSKMRRLPTRLRPSAQWLAKLSAAGGSALQIAGITANGPCDGIADEGDLLVAINGDAVTSHHEVEAKLRQSVADVEDGCAAEGGRHVDVTLTFLRRGTERRVTAPVHLLSSDGATRLVCWHGLVLREIPRPVREFGAVPAGVHISQTLLGSPGEADNIEGEFLLAVEGTPTKTLDDIIMAARAAAAMAGGHSKGQRHHLRVETADSSGLRFMKTLEPDPLFWPLFEIAQGPRGSWACTECNVGP